VYVHDHAETLAQEARIGALQIDPPTAVSVRRDHITTPLDAFARLLA
jgi:hypothetical protein